MAQRAFIVKIEINEAIDEQAVVEDITENMLADGYQVISVAPWASQEDAVAMAANTLGAAAVNPDDAGLGVPGVGGLGI